MKQPQPSPSLFDDDMAATNAANVYTLPVVPDPIRLAEQRIAAETPNLSRKTAELSIRAKAYNKVTSQDLLSGAELLAKEVQSHVKQILELHDPVVSHWHRKHADACELRKQLHSPAEALYQKLRKAVQDYLRAEQARRNADNERARLEAQRQEALRQAEHLRVAGPAAAPPPGPQPFVPPPIQSSNAQLSTSARRTVWKYEVTDMMATLRAVVAGRIPLEAVQINDQFMCEQVEKYRTSIRYPGIRVFEDVAVTIR